jgi:threonylcarbamoyladenosine tRNA methylthiotransferase MtaB
MLTTDPRRPPRTASVSNLGCKVSFADAERAATDLAARGVRLVAADARADLVVINTCTVTSEADRKSRQAVRRARRTNPDAEIVVTGCAAHMAPDAFAAIDPALRLVDGRSADALSMELAALFPGGGSSPNRALPTLSGVDVAFAALDGAADDRAREERTRAFVKVQDGCSFHCTYCIIPRARGAERSLPPERVLADVRAALATGRREVILTGINVGTYDGGASEPGPRGSHRWEALSLASLIRRILDETPVERIRLSSIEPQHVTDDLFRVWTDAPYRCLPHFHLPLQSGDDGVLRRMGRRYDSAYYEGLVGRIRAAIPGVAVHADVIVGFPTEDDDAWRRSVDFIRGLGLAGLHVFRYSERPGTPAVRMAGQVPEPVRRARSAELLAHAAERRATFAAAQVGRESAVLFEQRLDDGRWVGHADTNVLVAASAPTSLENVVARVALRAVDPAVPDRVDGDIVEVVHAQ